MSGRLCFIVIILIAVLLILAACESTSTSIPSPTPTTTPTLTSAPTIQETLAITHDETSTSTLAASQVPKTQAVVTKIIDGDTIEIDITGTKYDVRYIGVDTPELDDKRDEFRTLAQEANRYNRELVEGKTIQLEKDVSEADKYGRLLRYVYVDDLFVNAELVNAGYAQVVTYPPDVKYQDFFLQLQKEAKEAGIGLWATPSLQTPTPQAEPSNIQITYIFYDGIVPRVESDEYVEISNLGDQPQDLTGWILMDISEGYPSFTFPSYILAIGESIRVYTNEIHPESGGFSFGYGRAIWNNSDPDIAALYDNYGNEISRKSY